MSYNTFTKDNLDAVIHASSSMKDAINYVSDKFGLPNGWLNEDFMHTGSYTPKLNEFSVYYRTFYGVLTVRTVSAEYLVAMKLRSGRKYKNDLSDIIGILAEHEKRGTSITIDAINIAVHNLYGGWDSFPKDSKRFIEDAIKNGDFENVYISVKKEENKSKDILIEFEKDYPNVTKESNVNDIIMALKLRREKNKAKV